MGQSKMTEYKTVVSPGDPFEREWIQEHPEYARWEGRRRYMARRPGPVGKHTGKQRSGAPGGQTTEAYLLYNDGGPESKRKPY
jgi:hypothetical protein